MSEAVAEDTEHLAVAALAVDFSAGSMEAGAWLEDFTALGTVVAAPVESLWIYTEFLIHLIHFRMNLAEEETFS